MEDRDIHCDTDIEHAAEFILEAIVKIRVGNQIVGCQRNFRHHVCAGDFHLLVVNLRCEIQASGLRSVGPDALDVLLRAHLRNRNRVQTFVRQGNFAVKVNAYFLAEQHLGQYQTVCGLGFHHIGLISLYLYGEGVRCRRNTFIYSDVHVVLHLFQEVGEVLGKFLFVGDGNYLPICLVYSSEEILILLVVLCFGEVFCEMSHLVGIDNLTAHEDWLLERDCACEYVMDIQVERIVDFGSELSEGGTDFSFGQCCRDGLKNRALHNVASSRDFSQCLYDGCYFFIDLTLEGGACACQFA